MFYSHQVEKTIKFFNGLRLNTQHSLLRKCNMRIEKDFINKNVEDFLRTNIKKMQESVTKNPADERLRGVLRFYKNSLTGYETYKNLVANDCMNNRGHAVLQAAIEIESYYSTGVDVESTCELLKSKDPQDQWWANYIMNRCGKFKSFFDKLRMFELLTKLLKEEKSENGDAIFWLNEKIYDDVNDSPVFAIKFKLLDDVKLAKKFAINSERTRPLESYGGKEFVDKFKAIMSFREKEFQSDKYRTMAYGSYVS